MRKAVIIGVGPDRGLGAQRCKRFAGDGRAVGAAGRTQAALDAVVADIERSGGTASSFVADATNEADVTALFDHAGADVDLAIYNAGNNTVTLVPDEQLGSMGSYTISNPPSLLAKKNRPKKAVALVDLQGNPLEQGGSAGGVFSITISKGNPYAAAVPVLSDGS